MTEPRMGQIGSPLATERLLLPTAILALIVCHFDQLGYFIGLAQCHVDFDTDLDHFKAIREVLVVGFGHFEQFAFE